MRALTLIKECALRAGPEIKQYQAKDVRKLEFQCQKQMLIEEESDK